MARSTESAAKDPGDALRRALELRKCQILEAALQDGCSISQEDMESISRLESLLAMTTQPVQRRRARLAAALVVAGSLILTSLLFFRRVESEEIEIEASSAELSFRLAEQSIVLLPTAVRRVAITGLRSMRLPGQAADLEEESLLLEADEAGQGSVNLAAISAPKAARVSLKREPGGDHYRLTLEGDPGALQAALQGKVRITVPGVMNELQGFTVPQSLLLAPGPHPLSLDLHCAGQSCGLPPSIPIQGLSLDRLDRAGETELAAPRSRSTLLSGAIFHLELEGREHKLREAEQMRFVDPLGELRALHLAPEALAFRFSGTVRGIETGHGEHVRNLMPTWLEWWKAHHSLSLFWSSSLYLLTILFGALKWFKGNS